MNDILKILHLEDDPYDTELAREMLLADGLQVELERIDTLRDLRKRLESPERWDLILSDFSVPGTDIPEAIATARRLRPLTPLIVLSGRIGEEKAIEMFHLGVSDYVLKQRLQRLAPAVRRAVREAEEQTRRVTAEEALVAAKEAAEAGNRAKDRFMLTMSHELRTPLTVIMGMQELALTEDLPPDARHYLEAAREASESLLSLISDILDFSGIEKGEITLEEAPFHLHTFLREVVDSFLPRAVEKKLTLSLDIAPGTPSLVTGDSSRLRQILRNLLDNAVRFTEAGEIALDVSAAGGTEEGQEVSIAVRDTGIGIPDEALEGIFDRFSQADMSLTRRFGGTGLGLAISRGLVERMGGKIEARSRPGEGSVFSVILPLRATTEILHPPPRILVAEDEPLIGELMEMILKRENWEAEIVPDGRAALERWGEGKFDLILMDMQMPVMDGLEATRAIRLKEENGEEGIRRIPIVGVTAHAREEDRQACRDAGMDDVLVKPIQMPVLLEAVRKALG